MIGDYFYVLKLLKNDGDTVFLMTSRQTGGTSGNSM